MDGGREREGEGQGAIALGIRLLPGPGHEGWGREKVR